MLVWQFWHTVGALFAEGSVWEAEADGEVAVAGAGRVSDFSAHSVSDSLLFFSSGDFWVDIFCELKSSAGIFRTAVCFDEDFAGTGD